MSVLKRELQRTDTVEMFLDCGYSNMIKGKNLLKMMDWDELGEIPAFSPIISFINSLKKRPALNINEILEKIPGKTRIQGMDNLHLLMHYAFMCMFIEKTSQKNYQKRVETFVRCLSALDNKNFNKKKGVL